MKEIKAKRGRSCESWICFWWFFRLRDSCTYLVKDVHPLVFKLKDHILKAETKISTETHVALSKVKDNPMSFARTGNCPDMGQPNGSD